MRPVHLATTYLRDEDNAYTSGYIYGRPDNATVRDAEDVLAMLEDAGAGAARSPRAWPPRPPSSRPSAPATT